MLNIQLARKYGMAIFEIAQDEKKLEKYGKELDEVSQAVFSQAELKDFLTNPQIQPQDKKEVLLKLLKSYARIIEPEHGSVELRLSLLILLLVLRSGRVVGIFPI